MVVLCNALEFALSWTLFNADNVGACVVEVLVVEVLSWTTPWALVEASGSLATLTVPLLIFEALRLVRDAPFPEKDVAVTVPEATMLPMTST
jgi:hypothetical protein